MKENRVKYDTYGAGIPEGDARLELVPTKSSAKHQLLHWRAARALHELHEAAKSDGLDLRLASGWRKPRFATEAAYNAFVTERYGSVAEGRKFLAYKSAHHVGLAADFGTEGLEPRSATISKQKKTEAYAWLVANAERFGFTPYLREPWHWEYNISKAEWEQAPSEPSTWWKPAGIAASIAALSSGVYWLLKKRGR